VLCRGGLLDGATIDGVIGFIVGEVMTLLVDGGGHTTTNTTTGATGDGAHHEVPLVVSR